MDILVQANCKLGENPLWDTREACLYWTDIDGGTLHRFKDGGHDVIYSGEKVGGFTLQDDGSLLLFRVRDIARLVVGEEAVVLREVDEPGMARFNDVIAAPNGEVFAGTIGASKTSGGLYRVGLDGSVTKLFGGTGTANGMGFSPDLSAFYWTDSTARHIYRFAYDADTNALSARERVYAAAEDEGTPDGLAMAADGSFYSARFRGGAILHHAPDGEVLERLAVDAQNVSSAAFGGPNFDELFVTTAQGDGAGAGAIFHHKVGHKGRLEFRSRVLL
ncbi:SMP-30/gluconolactonase/LRE family protein [Truepera radiovictrix]|uniref:SMP-30/Gluconolaconase/LRE domain protein n=1 Tax=Truepera radiovictrix (strain DSM 17093 / CIP 108686 / LMG 22925 / RQ-24) TaxID=649638 RepID=D7CW76_TRURR|nr:SMP-30/gluconolactonase/LRE family protein [Truepera radiovictrix]ADI16026.1 SMP-30/Gluconolaconase/LRE domain protein [Truepera radiovictrix DSM 17093]WMT58347.1 SMP-30/gluconolactonase/LRE family protein [Truepera radiovictrix]